MKYLKKYALLLLILLCNQQVFAQYDIKVEISDSKDTALILGHYYLDKTYALDTAWNKNNTFHFKSKDKKLDSGIYFLSNLSGRFVEILIQNENKIRLKTKEENWNKFMQVKSGSEELKAYYNYMQHTEQIQEKAKELMEQKVEKEVYDKELKELSLVNDSIKQSFIKKYPDYLLSKVFNATKPITIPNFAMPTKEDGTADSLEWNAQRWYYYKNHYFDNIDLSCAGLLRTPKMVFFQNYNRYWDDVMKYERTDTIINYAHKVIAQAKDSKGMKRFLIHNITERYLQSPYMGHDKIYVELIKAYYETGIADWVSPSDMEKNIERAHKWENILLGKQVPDLACMDSAEVWHSTRDCNKEFKILLFWSPGCGHCSVEVPKYSKFYKEKKDIYSFEVFAINTESDLEAWKKFIREKDLQWINLNGLVANYDWREYFDIEKTPIMFILDKDNKIVAKNVPADNIDQIIKAVKEGKFKY
ncbi:MAG: thioredoxin-like domain-containing protein [Bacteroidales bacterium]|nr:thioredoxin-like domain-containing protein [Bacteroidales bacterium]